MSRASLVVALALVFLLPTVGFGDSITLGFISFDTLLPGGPSPGVNAFNIYNFTNGLLAPDFPVLDPITFFNSSVTLMKGGGATVIALGEIDPGVWGLDSLLFSDTELFTSVSFTATLNQTIFNLTAGSTFTAASPIITSTISPSSGLYLTPGDFALLSVSDTAVVPGPGTVWLVGIGLTALIIFATRKRTTME
jgi:hypothetical protein